MSTARQKRMARERQRRRRRLTDQPEHSHAGRVGEIMERVRDEGLRPVAEIAARLEVDLRAPDLSPRSAKDLMGALASAYEKLGLRPSARSGAVSIGELLATLRTSAEIDPARPTTQTRDMMSQRVASVRRYLENRPAVEAEVEELRRRNEEKLRPQ